MCKKALMSRVEKQIYQAVTVVPTFAPMITPMDWASERGGPPFTKLTTITVVALERLNESCDEYTGKYSGEPVSCHCRENRTHLVSCDFLDPFTRIFSFHRGINLMIR